MANFLFRRKVPQSTSVVIAAVGNNSPQSWEDAVLYAEAHPNEGRPQYSTTLDKFVAELLRTKVTANTLTQASLAVLKANIQFLLQNRPDILADALRDTVRVGKLCDLIVEDEALFTACLASKEVSRALNDNLSKNNSAFITRVRANAKANELLYAAFCKTPTNWSENIFQAFSATTCQAILNTGFLSRVWHRVWHGSSHFSNIVEGEQLTRRILSETDPTAKNDLARTILAPKGRNFSQRILLPRQWHDLVRNHIAEASTAYTRFIQAITDPLKKTSFTQAYDALNKPASPQSRPQPSQEGHSGSRRLPSDSIATPLGAGVNGSSSGYPPAGYQLPPDASGGSLIGRSAFVTSPKTGTPIGRSIFASPSGSSASQSRSVYYTPSVPGTPGLSDFGTTPRSNYPFQGLFFSASSQASLPPSPQINANHYSTPLGSARPRSLSAGSGPQ